MPPPSETHVLLLIQYSDGKPLREPVHATHLADDRYRLLYSPGFVQGIAAGDEFRLLDPADGRFEVIRRAGNLAVQLFSQQPVAPHRAELAALASGIGGTLDGAIDRGLAFTFPLKAGFPAIERLFIGWTADHPGWEWYFGNVYDPTDGVTPLNWWLDHPIAE